MFRRDVLAYAYACCKANGGAAGVDGQSWAAIEAYGESRWLDELAEALRRKTYRPQAVPRVWIPKPGGKQRLLGIPTVRDRVVQMAAVAVLGPVFEADLPPEQYAYRPGRSAHDAVRAVHRWVNAGHTEVVDADVSGYFDSIPHASLMKSVARRISDGAVLGLIKRWLTAAVEETDARGRRYERADPDRLEQRKAFDAESTGPVQMGGRLRDSGGAESAMLTGLAGGGRGRESNKSRIRKQLRWPHESGTVFAAPGNELPDHTARSSPC